MQLISACINRRLYTRRAFPKILAFCFHTSGALYNSGELLGIPIPIGRRPRQNPAAPPPALVLPPQVRYIYRTTPRMEPAEAEEFLYPLYLRGWRVEQIRTKEKSRRIRTPFLTSRYVLKDNVSARKAVSAIHALEETEKHDSCYEVFYPGKQPELSLRLQTHSARKWQLGKKNETSPHVTLRDVRFAVLFERIVQENGFLLDRLTSPHLLLNWDKFLLWFPNTQEK